MKNTKVMRIVGLNETYSKDVIIQFKDGSDWIQEVKTYGEFEDLMKTDFPEYWREYEESDKSETPESFFYNYGEDGDETYIFKA